MIPGLQAGLQSVAAQVFPAVLRCRAHAQGEHHLGLAAQGLAQRLGAVGGGIGLGQRGAGGDLVGQGQPDQQPAPDNGQMAQPGVEDEDAQQEDRGPGQVEKR